MIDQLSHRARRDPYGSKINRTHSPALAYAVPWVSIMLGSLIPQLPIASAVPLVNEARDWAHGVFLATHPPVDPDVRANPASDQTEIRPRPGLLRLKCLY